MGCERALARAQAANTASLAEDVLGIGQDAGGNCTLLAMRSERVVGMYTR